MTDSAGIGVVMELQDASYDDAGAGYDVLDRRQLAGLQQGKQYNTCRAPGDIAGGLSYQSPAKQPTGLHDPAVHHHKQESACSYWPV